MTARLGPHVLRFDSAAEIDRIADWMVHQVAGTLHRRGVIIAMSGGVDSSVCAALAVRAFGAGKVYGLLLPERDSVPASTDQGRQVAEHLGVRHEVFNISPTLQAIGCYRLRDEAIRVVFPEYADDWKCKVAIAGGAEGGINFFKMIVQSPDGRLQESRLPIREYLQIVAATNFKQRIRKTVEYYHADRLNYAVIGTPNRLEYDQGFFVKNGDGAADLKPIAHLYKTQVYALARHLGLARRRLQRHAHHRHVQPGPGTGRVLFRSALRPDGSGVVGSQPRGAGQRAGRRVGHDRGACTDRLRRH